MSRFPGEEELPRPSLVVPQWLIWTWKKEMDAHTRAPALLLVGEPDAGPQSLRAGGGDHSDLLPLALTHVTGSSEPTKLRKAMLAGGLSPALCAKHRSLLPP